MAALPAPRALPFQACCEAKAMAALGAAKNDHSVTGRMM
jgi:hypothetical protein